ncbi:MAG: flagellar basal body rod protein FlgB [Micavibrio aeruginosavorus]|uniref:Flagellar basal body rod protein FlgB n=1 Tax=Micavibrio aeruginosavorus TaxID=349221 RepID=A0A2W5HDQ3_9BACT|nr:MAG: flagellar basal body rod protein FlgB [Micavibrio aeruginosavorus]
MTTENISLFQAVGAKMHYLQDRQKVISQNISNANTPDYRPSDLSKVDFGSTLDNVIKNKNAVKPVRMEATSPGHMGFNQKTPEARAEKQKVTYEVDPDKNAVVLEEQMMKASDTQMNYNLMLNIYASSTEMIRTSIGRRN